MKLCRGWLNKTNGHLNDVGTHRIFYTNAWYKNFDFYAKSDPSGISKKPKRLQIANVA